MSAKHRPSAVVFLEVLDFKIISSEDIGTPIFYLGHPLREILIIICEEGIDIEIMRFSGISGTMRFIARNRRILYSDYPEDTFDDNEEPIKTWKLDKEIYERLTNHS